MERKRKVISGLSQVIVGRKASRHFTDLEKHQMIQDLLRSGNSKRDIWEKYTGRKEEHGALLRWMRELGYVAVSNDKSFNFIFDKKVFMSKRTNSTESDIEYFEILQLKKRISELELQLKDAEMKAIAFSTMVDIAEREFNIPIRKKPNTKPSKQ
jgi:hypothetical protein